MKLLCIHILLLLFTYLVTGAIDLIIAKADIRFIDESSITICLMYNHKFTDIPNYENKTWYDLHDGGSMCNNSMELATPPTTPKLRPFVLMSHRGNCTFEEMVGNALLAGADGLIVVFQSQQNLFAVSPNRSINRSFLLSSMTYSDYEKIKTKSETLSESISEVRISPYNIPTIKKFPYSSLILFGLATFIIFCGSILSGKVNYRSSPDSTQSPANYDVETSETRMAELPVNENSDKILVTSGVAMMLLFMAIVTLLLIFYFFKYLVIFYIIFFALYSAHTLFQVFDYLVLSNYYNNETYRSHTTLIRWSCGLALSSISVWWGICRNEWYAWILLDFLATNMIIIMLKVWVMPNFKVCTQLLLTFLIYDVFFVFISPYLFSGSNVMLDAATGNHSGVNEKIPFTLEMPHIYLSNEENCFNEVYHSILGFGDIVLPGFVISFLKVIDVKLGNKTSVYFITGLFGYVLGLSCTITALILMQMAQPAILYLAPCVLISVYIVAAYRGQVNLLHKPSNIQKISEEAITASSSSVNGDN